MQFAFEEGSAMVTVIVLIQVKPGTAADVCAVAEKIEQVQKAYIVTGPYDVIAIAELPSRAGFRRLVDEFHEAPGVTRTETCMSI
ncbi:MAG: Lrp/AsnC family transcriptional regulator [Candidatus Thorarchaeota archaeon]|jgi:DNA-binding Lrp family transcriptional regulator